MESTAGALEGLGHRIAPGAPVFDADAVADAIAVLHNVSNVQLYNFATDHLGREPREDEFEPSEAAGDDARRLHHHRRGLRRRHRPHCTARPGSSRPGWPATTCC